MMKSAYERMITAADNNCTILAVDPAILPKKIMLKNMVFVLFESLKFENPISQTQNDVVIKNSEHTDDHIRMHRRTVEDLLGLAKIYGIPFPRGRPESVSVRSVQSICGPNCSHIW